MDLTLLEIEAALIEQARLRGEDPPESVRPELRPYLMRYEILRMPNPAY